MNNTNSEYTYGVAITKTVAKPAGSSSVGVIDTYQELVLNPAPSVTPSVEFKSTKFVCTLNSYNYRTGKLIFIAKSGETSEEITEDITIVVRWDSKNWTLPLNRYTYVKDGTTYDLANLMLCYSDSRSTTRDQYTFTDYDGEILPFKFTPYSALDNWTIPTFDFSELFGGMETSKGIEYGSKPQFFWGGQQYVLRGDSPNADNTNDEYQFYKLVPDTENNKVSIYDFGTGNNETPSSWDHTGKTANYTIKLTSTLTGNYVMPKRLIALIQAAGGGGGGASEQFGSHSVSAGGGGAGGMAFCIIDSTKTWYVRIGKAGYGGYGNTVNPSTGGGNIDLSMRNDFDYSKIGTDASAIMVKGGEAGGEADPNNPSAPTGGIGGYVDFIYNNQNYIWPLDRQNKDPEALYDHGTGAKGGDGAGDTTSAQPGWDCPSDTIYTTNVLADRGGVNIWAKAKNSGGAAGDTTYIAKGGAGGGASIWYDGGKGGTINSSSETDWDGKSGGYGSGGGGSIIQYSATKNKDKGGNGGVGLIQFFAGSDY